MACAFLRALQPYVLGYLSDTFSVEDDAHLAECVYICDRRVVDEQGRSFGWVLVAVRQVIVEQYQLV